MIIRNEDLKSICSKILPAVDNNELSTVTETLELKTVGSMLCINVTNKDYFAQVRLDLKETIDFHATVNAKLFLKLIAQTTAECIDLTTTSNYLMVKGNGSYKLPLIFDGDKLMELPEIVIDNVTNEFNMSSDTLASIAQYNGKQLTVGTTTHPVQKMYYIDEHGAITFNTGACINSFELDQPIRLLLNDKLVKLFKLFHTSPVKVTIGMDLAAGGTYQTKVKFEIDNVTLIAKLFCDPVFMNAVPAARIRERAFTNYKYSVNLDKAAFLETINRLALFSSGLGTKENLKPYSVFEFNTGCVTIYDSNRENKEVLDYVNEQVFDDETYVAILDLNDLKATLETCSEQYLTLYFGNHKAFVLSRGNIKNVIPEISKHD